MPSIQNACSNTPFITLSKCSTSALDAHLAWKDIKRILEFCPQSLPPSCYKSLSSSRGP